MRQVTAQLLQLLWIGLTLDYPQIDEWLIKALAVTLAPFGQPEKPQVFPRPAASFIKNGPDISMLEAIGGRRRRERRRFWKGAGGTVMPVLIGIFCDDLTQPDRASRSFESVSAGLLRLEMMLLIFTAGPMRWFRFGLDRHNFAT
jgi:hypothetical protein